MITDWKLFYSFRCPISVLTDSGHPDVKIGVTSQPFNRLGVYQAALSQRNWRPRMDTAYLGPCKVIETLEGRLKTLFDKRILRAARGENEWVADVTIEEVDEAVQDLIDNQKFKIFKIDNQFLPFYSDMTADLKEFYNLK